MPIKISMPSDDVMAVVAEGTSMARSVSTMGYEHISEDNIPHKVYIMGLDDIAAGAGIERAKMAGWRIFHHEDGEASVEIHSDEAGGGLQFGGINRGPFVQGLRAALEEVSSLGRFDDDEYELNILKIPALYIMALWMRHQNPEADSIIPVAPTHQRVEPNRDYTPAEFFAELQDDAVTRLSFDDSPGQDS